MKKIIGIIIAVAVVAIAGIAGGYYVTHQNNGTTTTNTISETEAQAIALEDAGLAEGDVSFTKTKLDRDDGRSQYDIEFIASADNTKYDYEIDAESGAILSADRETGRNGSTTTANSTTTGQQAEGEITSDEAKAIALQHAGVNEADALYINIEYDRDDNRNEWSVDFATQDTEYDYEINAADGSVLKAEKEAHNR